MSPNPEGGPCRCCVTLAPPINLRQYNSAARTDEISVLLTCMLTKLNTEILTAAIAGYEEQKRRLDAQIAELRQMLSPGASDVSARGPRKRRRMSAAARARMAAAQQKRWAKAKQDPGAVSSGTPGRKKRKLSAAGRRAIIEATKRRWAAFRKAKAA